jgi:hypothetical protein
LEGSFPATVTVKLGDELLAAAITPPRAAGERHGQSGESVSGARPGTERRLLRFRSPPVA